MPSNAGTRGLNCSGLGLIVLSWAERNWSQGVELGWTGWRASNLDMAGGRGAGSSGHEATEECIRLVLAGAVVLWDLISPLGQLCPQALAIVMYFRIWDCLQSGVSSPHHITR